jgi:anaerobic magnesium-protoporphyrin IX monomethyl ester cyclase
MYNIVKEKGWLRITDFDKYDTTRPIFETPQLSMKELGKLRESAFHHYYLCRAYIFDKKRRFKISTALVVGMHLIANLKLRLRRN